MKKLVFVVALIQSLSLVALAQSQVVECQPDLGGSKLQMAVDPAQQNVKVADQSVQIGSSHFFICGQSFSVASNKSGVTHLSGSSCDDTLYDLGLYHNVADMGLRAVLTVINDGGQIQSFSFNHCQLTK